MRKNLIAISIVSAALIVGNEPGQIARQQPAMNQASISLPFHCQVPVHAARFFAGSLGIAVGLGGADKHPQACVLVRVPGDGSSDNAKF